MKFITSILSIALSILILVNSMQVSITYAYYEVDTIGFIEKLCENKDQPKLECNGKCYLKKVSESKSSEDKKLPNILDFKELLLFQDKFIDYTLTNTLSNVLVNYEYQNFYSSLYLQDCFHPPKLAIS